jgi:hypothetical protein
MMVTRLNRDHERGGGTVAGDEVRREPMPAPAAVHDAYVAAWLDGAAKGVPPAQLIGLFERALGALWQRALSTLGEVTLTAIVDRVLYTASEKFPILSALSVEGAGIRFEELRSGIGAGDDGNLLEAVRFVLVELLSVLGNLTAQILTPALHEALSKVSVDGVERMPAEEERSQSGIRAGDDQVKGNGS